MNTPLNATYLQKGLTRKDVLTAEEIKQFEKTLTAKKVKSSAVVAVGASTILISSVQANADFTANFLPKSLFDGKEEKALVVIAPETAKASLDIVPKEKTKGIETKKEETIEAAPEKPIVPTVTLAEAKTQSEKAIEARISTLAISAHETEFLNAVKKGAFDSWKEYGILPSVLTAQAILESDWGTSELALFGNALFGVKASNWNGKTYKKRTREVYNGKEEFIYADFRAYDSWAESMIDHGKFLNKERYSKAIGEKDFKKSITAIFKAGYATDPEYVEKITRVVTAYNLDKWDAEVISAYDAHIASIGPADMEAFVSYLNGTTSEKRLEKIASLTKEEAVETFKTVGADAMKNWKNAEMEALFKAFQSEEMNKFLHGNYKNKYLDKVAALALVILGDTTATKEQTQQLRAMEAIIAGQVNVGDMVLTDEAGIQAYVALEEKINNIQTDYSTVTVPEVMADFSGKVIVLDPGHGGKDPGARNIYANGNSEAANNLRLVNSLKQALEARGATVYLTNDGSTYVELSDRVKFAVEKNADLFFSIHFNSNDDRLADGTEIFYNHRSAESKQLAKTVFAYQKQALHTIETRSNGANTGNYEVLRTANAYNLPAILTEALFMSNPYEVLLLENDNVQASLVNGYVAGLADYFSLIKEEVAPISEEILTEDQPDTVELVSEETEVQPATTETPSEESAEQTTEQPTPETEETTNEDATQTESSSEMPEEKEEKEKTEEEHVETTETTSSPTAEANKEKDSFFLFELFEKFAE